MAQAFQPLTSAAEPPAPGARLVGRLKVLPSGSVTVRPLESAKPTPAPPSPPPAPAAMTVAPTGPETAPPPAPTLEVTRDGDRISKITIHCSCGERIELACDY